MECPLPDSDIMKGISPCATRFKRHRHTTRIAGGLPDQRAMHGIAQPCDLPGPDEACLRHAVLPSALSRKHCRADDNTEQLCWQPSH